ncbi:MULTISPECIES: DUF2809 domain-containing protein [unclassified Flavobacterium]|uniref:ribosomal maturation YjgA family protein n=1 Tax=unclassified Flavobacterium TaxID=196869 RepID=UPI003F90AD54
MFTFNKNYFTVAILLFVIEVLIAVFVHDSFVRPYLGDALVVILIYCFIKSFLKLAVVPVVLFVLAFSFTIEYLQYLDIVHTLHLENSKIARTILGTSFSWIDLLTYLIGLLIVMLFEKYGLKKDLNSI